MGGAISAIEKGFMQREIMESSYRYQKEEEAGKRVVIGVNKFRSDQEVEPMLFRVDPKVEEEQKTRLQKFKENRDPGQVKALVQSVQDAASQPENLMTSLIEAVKGHVTVGEICEALKDVFGVYKEVNLF